MHTATSILGTGAGVNSIHSFMILNELKNRMKWNKLPPLLATKKQPQPLDGLNLVHLRHGKIRVQILLKIVPNLAVMIQHDTWFLDCLYLVFSAPNENSYHGALNQSLYWAESPTTRTIQPSKFGKRSTTNHTPTRQKLKRRTGPSGSPKLCWNPSHNTLH